MTANDATRSKGAMMSLRERFPVWSGKAGLRRGRDAICQAMVLSLCLGLAQSAKSQVVQAGNSGLLRLSAGGTASGYYLNYGEQRLLGGSAFFDAQTRRHLGVEAEVRILEYHNSNDVNAATYLAGFRYFRDYGRLQPYAKGLVGFGRANLAFGLGQANSLVIAPGGGFDYRLNRRVFLRLADFEYQRWPEADYGSAPPFDSIGISSGIRFRFF